MQRGSVSPTSTNIGKYTGTMTAEELLDRLTWRTELGLHDVSTDTDYLPALSDFSAGLLSPIVYKNGASVGRAFVPDADGLYDFLLVADTPAPHVLLRRDLWEEFYASAFTLSDSAYVDRSTTVELRFTAFGTREINTWKTLNRVDSVGEWATAELTTLSSKAAASVSQAEKDTSSFMARGGDEIFRKVHEVLEDVIRVDNVYYGRFGRLEDNRVTNSRGDTIGKVFVKANGSAQPDFVAYQGKSYLIENKWNETVFPYTQLIYKNWQISLEEYQRDLTSPDREFYFFPIKKPERVSALLSTALLNDWNQSQAAPTRKKWTGYLKGAIRIDGLPAVPLHNIASDFDVTLSGEEIRQHGKTVAKLFAPTLTVPPVRLGNDIYVPVTLLGAQYDKATNALIVKHTEAITTSVVLTSLELQNISLADLKKANSIRIEQTAQATRSQAAAQAQQAQTQAAQRQQQAAAQTRQATAQAERAAAQAKDLAAAGKKAPGMSVVPVGNGMFAGFKLVNNKVFIRMLRVSDTKVSATCDQQSADSEYVLRVLDASGIGGAFTLTALTPNGIAKMTTFLRSGATCNIQR